MDKTNFETDLSVYFPDIYKLHLLGKEDKKLWVAVYELIKMMKPDQYGRIEITIQNGIINHVNIINIK